MKKKLSAAFLFFAMILNAQINFEKGYSIDNAGNTTICYIKNLDWRNNPTTFKYKMSADGSEELEGKISDYQEFGIDDDTKFIRHTVNIERTDNMDLNNLGTSKKPAFKLETLYLKPLVTGAASLYVYKDGNITKYFYETDLIPTEQLIYFKYLSNEPTNSGLDSNGGNIKSNNQFWQQLFNNVRCENDQSDFRKIEFKKNELIKVFEKYNVCHQSEKAGNVNYDKKKSRKNFALKVVVGIYSAKLSASGTVHYYNVGTDLKKPVYKIGADAEYILPFNNAIWSIVFNPSYHKFSTSGDFTDANGFGQNIDYNVTATYSTLELPLGVRRYFYINSASKIFVNALYSFNFPVSGSINFDNPNYGPNGKGSYSLNQANNFSIGAGYAYRKFSAEIRVNTPATLNQNEELDLKYNTIGFILGYSLF